MNKTSLIILLLVVFLVSIVFNFSITHAQSDQNKARAGQNTSPTPPEEEPTPPPLPEIDDAPIVIKAELVKLNVRVVDRDNRPISDLRQNDFKIFEDNVSQPIESFDQEEVPTNYSLVIDNSGSMRYQLEKVIEASKIIVGTNRPDDETSIIRFVSTDKIEILQDFTPSKIDLDDALESLFVEGGRTAIIDAVYLAAERVENYEKTDPGNDRKRRALILVSDGEDRESFYKEPQLYDLLRESDVQIYAIGFVNDLEKEGGFISKSPQGKAKAFLERLASETGGKVFFPQSLSELNGIAQEIASELRTQFSISYRPTNDENDGSYRNIKVAVADGPKNQKRIAISRTGRKASVDGVAPTFSTPVKKSKSQ